MSWGWVRYCFGDVFCAWAGVLLPNYIDNPGPPPHPSSTRRHPASTCQPVSPSNHLLNINRIIFQIFFSFLLGLNGEIFKEFSTHCDGEFLGRKMVGMQCIVMKIMKDRIRTKKWQKCQYKSGIYPLIQFSVEPGFVTDASRRQPPINNRPISVTIISTRERER